MNNQKVVFTNPVYKEICDFRLNNWIEQVSSFYIVNKPTDNQQSSENFLCNVGGDIFLEASSVIERSNRFLRFAIIDIIKDMLSTLSLRPKSLPEEIECCPRSFYYNSFMLVTDQGTDIYVFGDGFHSLGWNDKDVDTLRKKCHNLNNINVVFLSQPTGTMKDLLNRNIEALSTELLHFSFIDEFFTRFFSTDDWLAFNTLVEESINEANLISGYKAVLIPNDAVLSSFKNMSLQVLQNPDFNPGYDQFLSFFSKEAFELMQAHFNAIVSVMIEDKNFARSFISSEWHYQINKANNSLEQTSIVAGYLKSVEQLLYQLILLQTDTGMRCMVYDSTNDDNKTYWKELKDALSEKTCSIQHNLLDLINIFSNENNDEEIINSLFYSDIATLSELKSIKQLLIDKLDFWRKNYRNGNFHLDNIYKIDVVNKIRESAFCLYFLLLGCINVPQNKLSYLGFRTKKQKENLRYFNNSLNYKRLSSWLLPIIHHIKRLGETDIYIFLSKDFSSDENDIHSFNLALARPYSVRSTTQRLTTLEWDEEDPSDVFDKCFGLLSTFFSIEQLDCSFLHDVILSYGDHSSRKLIEKKIPIANNIN